MNNSAIRAPIEKILPSFAPVFFERGIPGYATETLSPGERRISPDALRPLLVASAFIGAWNHAVERGLDSDKVVEVLKQSIPSIADFASADARRAQELVDRFMSFHIIREEHPLDDWLCEALWSEFQLVSYKYPSAMSRIISYALGISDTLQKMTLEFGPNNSFQPQPLRNSAPDKDGLSALSDSALADVKNKWIVFDRAVQLNDSVSLGQKVDLFAEPLSELFQTKYPALLLGGSQVFWLTIFTAVLESGTHSKAAVNDAIAELRGKYAGKA